MSHHLIDRIKFDIQAENTQEAKEIQDKVFSICRHQLATALNASLSDDTDQYTFRLERLELDLGYIPKHALDAQLIPKIIEQFASAVEGLIGDLTANESGADHLEALILYLEKGLRHWAKNSDYEPHADLIKIITNEWSAFLNFLKKTPFSLQVSKRIVEIASIQTYFLLIKCLKPSDAEFIVDFTKSAIHINQKSEKIAIARQDWELELKALILHDLIKNYDTLFNRKMFIRRQLMSLSVSYRLSYLVLLRAFDALLTDLDLGYRYHSSLPALLKELSEDAHLSKPVHSEERPEAGWEDLLDKQEWASIDIDRLNAQWPLWIRQYAGEMKLAFEKKVKNIAQVEFLLATLTDEMVDDVIDLLIPHLSRYIISYKVALIKGNKQSNRLVTAEDNLRHTLNFLILSYLTLDMGSAFNKKAFFTSQVVRLSRHYNLSYSEVFSFLISSLEGSNEPILFGMLELVKQINKGLFAEPDSDSGPLFKTYDELELLRHYLLYGQVHAELRSGIKISPFEFMLHILNQGTYKQALIDFIQRHPAEIASTAGLLDIRIFLAIVKILLSEKVKLSPDEVKIIAAQVKKHLRQSVNQSYYSTYVLEFLLSLKSKLKSEEVRKYDIDEVSDPYSLLCRYVIIKLSLDEFYNDHLNEGEPAPGIASASLSYDQARARLFASLDHMGLIINASEFYKNQLQLSFRKIFESKQERRSLLNMLNGNQAILLLRHANRVNRYKFLKATGEESLMIGTILDELDEDAVTDKYLRAWEYMIQLNDLSRSEISEKQLENGLRLFSLNRAMKESIRLRWRLVMDDHRVKKTGEINYLKDFFETGNQPDGWTMVQLENVFMKHYTSNFKELSRTLQTIVYQQESVRKLYQILRKNLMVRWLKIMIGNGYDEFISQISDLERIWKHIDRLAKWQLTNATEFKKLKVLVAFEYQFNQPTLTQIVHFYLRFFEEKTSMRFSSLIHIISSHLKQITKEIPSPPGRVSEVQTIIDANLDDKAQPLTNDNAKGEYDVHDQSYKVENAGLIITWPFLKNLFGQLEFLSESGTFKHAHEQSKAVRLLQYVATGVLDAPEYNMTLNKLLCGYPLVEPIIKGVTCKESEMKLADSMLGGLITNWPKLGNTSIEGLRNTFLLRNGSLSYHDGNWILRVEKKGMDVLLEYLPWTISNIKLPWSEEMLFVEWR